MDRTASTSRYCEIFKATNGRWYLLLGDFEYAEWEDSTAYGPFSSENAADNYIRNFSNPGALDVDDSGTKPPPTKSPNGRPVVRPAPAFPSYGRYARLGAILKEEGLEKTSLKKMVVPFYTEMDARRVAAEERINTAGFFVALYKLQGESSPPWLRDWWARKQQRMNTPVD